MGFQGSSGDSMNEVTQVPSALEKGESQAAEQLLPLVYTELRRLAAWHMAKEKPGHTLQATALVHEAWLRVSEGQNQHWDSRRHFFAAAAEAMRRILVDSARRKQAVRHGGGLRRTELDGVEVAAAHPDEEVLAVHEALDALAAHDGRKADLVRLHYFAGLTLEETASALGMSVRTAKRDWAYARVWLFREIKRSR
jgi:RNA polymerase sigma factor (TIGR02999 family)